MIQYLLLKQNITNGSIEFNNMQSFCFLFGYELQFSTKITSNILEVQLNITFSFIVNIDDINRQ